jgi:hypothetical protein
MITSLPEQTQRLLVLLFGTFRVIATHANRANTGMSSEALGVSVAPSFFQSCVSDGKQARMEDVLRYKVRTVIIELWFYSFVHTTNIIYAMEIFILTKTIFFCSQAEVNVSNSNDRP